MNAKQILRKLLESHSSRKKLQEDLFEIDDFLKKHNLQDGWVLYYPFSDTDWIEGMVRTFGLDSKYGAQIYTYEEGNAIYLPPDRVDKNDRATVKDILKRTVRYLNRKYKYSNLWDYEVDYAIATAYEEPFVGAETLDNFIAVDYDTGEVDEEW